VSVQKTVILFITLLSFGMPGTATAVEYIDPTPMAQLQDASPCALTTRQEYGTKDANHISVVLNDSVEDYIEYYTTARKDVLQSWLDNSAIYLPLMKNIFRIEGLPVELVYIAMIESGLNAKVVSSAQAVGPWQFMQDTAQEYGLRNNQWVDERRDYIKSSVAAAQYFRELLTRFGSWPLALAAYNGGARKVQNAMLRTGSRDFWDIRESAYLSTETKNFVPRFMAVSIIARNPAAYGFRTPAARELCFDVILIQGGVADLRVVAEATNSTYAAIKRLNPEINGMTTPPDTPQYLLKIPEDKKYIFLTKQTIAAKDGKIEFLNVLSSLLRRAGPQGEFSHWSIAYAMTSNKFTFSERSDKPVVHGTVDASTITIITGYEENSDRELPFLHDLNRPSLIDYDQDVDI
jgi:hypothetical protein